MVLAAVFCAGCASYAAPGGPAPMAALVAVENADGAPLPPTVNRPVSVNLVRVQAADYAALSADRVATGAFSVVMPTERAARPLKTVARWPLVEKVETLRPALLPERLNTLDDLRLAAAKNLADLLIVYTVDTRFELDGRAVEPLADLPTGKAPDGNAAITSAASVVLIDVRTGFRYGSTQASARTDDLSGAWLTGTSLDRKRLDTEQLAIDALLSDAEKIWRGVVAYDVSGGAAPDLGDDTPAAVDALDSARGGA